MTLSAGFRQLRASAVVLIAAALVIGCSANDTFEQPAQLPDVNQQVSFERVWDVTVGDGHDGEFLYLAPLNAGDVVYAASADGELLALNAETGKQIWENSVKDRIFAGVGGDDKQLYLVSRDADLLALSREDGSELWRASLPTEVLSAPQSNGSLVVVQTTDGRVLAFNAADGEKRWQYDSVVPALSVRASAAPLVGADVIISGFANGKLLALSAESGQPLWQYEVGAPQGRTELERLVDITSQPLVLENAILAVGYQGKLALIDLRTGNDIWSKTASSLYSPMVSNGNIFLASANGDLVAMRGSDRRDLWTQDKLAWRQLTQPVPLDDYLVVGDFDGYLHVVSQESGELVGQMKFDGDGIRVPAQRLSNGNLLIFGNGGKLAAYKLQSKN
ncbi:outer membrane protein assembly factor BamB [Marinobacter sp. M3C]|uniref:outer membrane protein assembly factor BamB n=1 Tax=unclassified Marinobacter TaxID=83889 RepID=UPI0020102AAF|nr:MULTISPECIES: outer membrane protein assembly factor BamB [unclassified Marinobacter]MCL1478676.1 outer membrane protein assembly factor BamB [Marinobacter sp.]MCL1481973.1 outer membrane protein assembly factor BamB [Marinobacter sp.]MCL1484313.1 outer membrane protein assembly factor BamB [Marinobacter sp.]MCL1488164.1 outer membrane protein assembly factor BamB [Marinobacter sp.]UQG57840.1 outer membrane protein assembly factor BamB [Marinobacter sp. M4C]